MACGRPRPTGGVAVPRSSGCHVGASPWLRTLRIPLGRIASWFASTGLQLSQTRLRSTRRPHICRPGERAPLSLLFPRVSPCPRRPWLCANCRWTLGALRFLLESLLNTAAPCPSTRPQFSNLAGESDAKHLAQLQFARADFHDLRACQTKAEREYSGLRV